MKYLLILLTVLLCNCSSQWMSYPTYNESEKTALIRVECKNLEQVESSVIHVLKVARYNDLEKESNISSVTIIKARFQELSYYNAMQLINDLKSISNVFDVQVIRDGVPVKNVR